MDFELSEETRMLVELVEKFVQNELMPLEPTVNVPGLAFAMAMISAASLAEVLGPTTSTFGERTAKVIGWRSFSGS